MKTLYVKIIVIFLITIILGVFWLANTHLFPKPPENIALFLVNLFGAETQEDVANIEMFYVFFISALIATAIVNFFPYKKILASLSKGRS